MIPWLGTTLEQKYSSLFNNAGPLAFSAVFNESDCRAVLSQFRILVLEPTASTTGHATYAVRSLSS